MPEPLWNQQTKPSWPANYYQLTSASKSSKTIKPEY